MRQAGNAVPERNAVRDDLDATGDVAKACEAVADVKCERVHRFACIERLVLILDVTKRALIDVPLRET